MENSVFPLSVQNFFILFYFSDVFLLFSFTFYDIFTMTFGVNEDHST